MLGVRSLMRGVWPRPRFPPGKSISTNGAPSFHSSPSTVQGQPFLLGLGLPLPPLGPRLLNPRPSVFPASSHHLRASGLCVASPGVTI